MSWFNGIVVSVGVPLVCAGVAYIAASVNNNNNNNKSQHQEQPTVTTTQPTPAGAKAKKRKNKKNKPKHNDAAVRENHESSSTSEDEVVMETTPEDDILLLAKVNGSSNSISNSSSSSSLPRVSGIVKRTPDIVMAPIIVPNDANEEVKGIEEDGWTRVPTRQEEAINNLRQKIDSLTKQLNEQTDLRQKEKFEVERDRIKSKEMEHDFKERIKALLQQVSNLDNELQGLRANNDYLTDQFTSSMEELDQANVRVNEVNGENERLKRRVCELEHELATKKEECTDAVAQLNNLKETDSGLNQKLKASESQLSYLKEENNQLTVDVNHMKAWNGELIEQLDAVKARLLEIEDGYTANNQYIMLLMEGETNWFSEKYKLVTDLVAIRKTIKAMADCRI